MTTSAVTVHNESGRHEIVLVCEHASATISAEFNGLGLDTNAALSPQHAIWRIVSMQCW
jgi:predicted N-formylglutamate amidohydrolase